MVREVARQRESGRDVSLMSSCVSARRLSGPRGLLTGRFVVLIVAAVELPRRVLASRP